ncbi:MAG: aminotransferase class I/II-fold pyridoxal phosphate-dependent enzyme [Alicyclobacillus sp.]|nr:aminotransferase class I/II-fold pyridoxal phosphate-dependent enzyme [Alicyclobacillus sp.]
MQNTGYGLIRPESPPFVPSSVYTFPDLEAIRAYYAGSAPGYLYRRNGNPNTDQLEEALCQLTGAAAAVFAASGMAAIAQACFSLLKPGDHLVATRHLYGGTYALFEQVLRPWGISVDYVDMDDGDSLAAALRPNTALLYVETIANPLLQVADLEAIGRFAAAHSLRWMVDNTFASPYLARPHTFGADVVVESLTKFLGGHSDVMGGVCYGSADVMTPIRTLTVTVGGVLSAFDAWMTQRSLQTFHLRMPQHCRNALALAEFLRGHPAVEQVFYPGLPDSPWHAIARRVLFDGFGAMVSIHLRGGEEAVNRLLRACRHVALAPSLGGTRTTVSHPALTSHRAFSPAERAQLDIRDGTVRISVGTEPFEVILEDLRHALDEAR